MGDVESTVTSSLEYSVNSVSDGGSDESDIEDGLERSLVLVVCLGKGSNIVVLSINGLSTLVESVEPELLEQSSGNEETSAVRRCVVGESSLESESLELVGVSMAEHSVTLKGGVDNLGDALGVSESDHKSIFIATELVHILENHPLSCVVVSLSFSPPSELGLVSLKVLSRFNLLNVAHFVFL